MGGWSRENGTVKYMECVPSVTDETGHQLKGWGMGASLNLEFFLWRDGGSSLPGADEGAILVQSGSS